MIWVKPGDLRPLKPASAIDKRERIIYSGPLSHYPSGDPPCPLAKRPKRRGRRLDLIDPSPLDVEIEDIAHGLARVARWNGQTTGDHAYSVAQHSLLVTDLAQAFAPDWDQTKLLAALLHDAPEYVIGDMISPFKAALGVDYRDFEGRLEAAIHVRFGIPVQTPKHVERTIKRADVVSAYLEAVELAGFEPDEAAKIFGRPRLTPAQSRAARRWIKPMPASDAQAAYLKRFATLAAK